MLFHYGVEERHLKFFFQHQQLMWDALAHTVPPTADPGSVEWMLREERCDSQWF